MFEAAASGLPHLDLPKIVLAIGSLGTAAYGVVDVSKGFGGGISNRGFGDIKKVISQFIPASSASGSALSLTSVLATLRSNWLNGMPLADQKSVAKALIKLNLNATSASGMAAATAWMEKFYPTSPESSPVERRSRQPRLTPTAASIFCSPPCWTKAISGAINATETPPSWLRFRWRSSWRCWERGPLPGVVSPVSTL